MKYSNLLLLSLTLMIIGCSKEEPDSPKLPPPAPKPVAKAVSPKSSAFDLLKAVDGATVYDLKLVESPNGSRDLGYGNCQWLRPHDKAQEELLREPDYKSAKPIYYAAWYGDSAKDKIHTFVLDESKDGGGYDTVYIDVNNDNRIDGQTEEFAIKVGNPSHSEKVRIKLEIGVEGKRLPYYASLGAFTYKDNKNNPVEKIHMNLRNSSYWAGTVKLDGKDYKFAAADLNSNGLFNDYEKRMFNGDRLFIDHDKNDSLKDDGDRFPYSQYIEFAGKWYETAVKPTGEQIAFLPHKAVAGALTGPKEYAKATMFSDTLNRTVFFSGGKGQTLVGEYKLGAAELQCKDSYDNNWTMSVSFRKDHPAVKVTQENQGKMPELLPVKVSLKVKEKKKGEIIIEHQFAGALGGEFRCPRTTKNRPSGGFTVEDMTGKIVAQGKFEYG